MDNALKTFSDSASQQAWWQSLTPAQQEAYNDAERRNAERKRYGRELAEHERTMILSGDLHPSQIIAAQQMVRR